MRDADQRCSVIMMTGTAELITDADGVHFDDRRQDALAAGACAYLSKPIDFTELLAQLDKCFEL